MWGRMEGKVGEDGGGKWGIVEWLEVGEIGEDVGFGGRERRRELEVGMIEIEGWGRWRWGEDVGDSCEA